jgi:CelD/BcsL family acetyltransferase involved in cellulose biosynthesis
MDGFSQAGGWKLVEMAVLEVGRPSGHALSGASRLRVEFMRDWKQAAARWSAVDQGTVFQSRLWLDAWYGAFDDVSPLIAIVSEQFTGRDVALVPLVRRAQGGIRVVEFADLDLTDYNAPLLGPGASDDPAEAEAVNRALLAALRQLPEGADLLRMRKMPATLGGRPNPLVSLGRTGSCSLNGNLIEVDDFDAYRASIKRMQLPRSWRVFSRYPGAQFRLLTDADEALGLLDTMDHQQQSRMQCLGLRFNLNQGARARFYRDLIRSGIGQGYAVVSELRCDEAIVATVFGIRREKTFVFLRISNAGRRWSHCSPSRLIIERTMAALHGQGVREFDLSVGNYAFKRRFGATPLPLTDVSIALGWRGLPLVLRDRSAQRLRRHPWLAEKVWRALGRLSHDQE